MSHIFCGIDFGTSNSSIAVAGPEQSPVLVPVENNKPTIPSTIFYQNGKNAPLFGSEAVNAYINGEQGRLMRSLKRVLGTDLMNSGTILNGKSVKFENILSQFIKNLKDKAQALHDCEAASVVMGRPVHFRDNDAKGDARAEAELTSVAKAVGFQNIVFQFEPIAAAYAHEVNIPDEKLACVVDIGGGTSDFTIIRIGRKLQSKADRSDDILASAGIRIGGNDFDKNLTIKAFMPELGLKTTYGDKNLFVPSSQYFDLAEWSKVNSVYSYQNKRTIQQVLAEAHEAAKYKRLLELVEKEQGHHLLGEAEKAKINLTDNDEYQVCLDFLDDKPLVHTFKTAFEDAINENVMKISASLKECLHQAGITSETVELIVLTGGSTEIPFVQQELCRLFRNAVVSGENKLSSVGLGLAYDSLRKFA